MYDILYFMLRKEVYYILMYCLQLLFKYLVNIVYVLMIKNDVFAGRTLFVRRTVSVPKDCRIFKFAKLG